MNLKNNRFKIDKKQLYSYHYIKDMFLKHLFFQKQENTLDIWAITFKVHSNSL